MSREAITSWPFDKVLRAEALNSLLRMVERMLQESADYSDGKLERWRFKCACAVVLTAARHLVATLLPYLIALGDRKWFDPAAVKAGHAPVDDPICPNLRVSQLALAVRVAERVPRQMNRCAILQRTT